MGLNSTEIPYQFGQFGSTFLSGDSSQLDLDGSTAKYYVCAISFITATQFQELQVLDAGENLGFGDTHFISTEDSTSVGTLDSDWGAVTDAGDNDAKPIVAGGSGTTFPAGMTIYGMWDFIELHSGSCVVYVAPRPDYNKRSAAI
jgi:hypothetical protein